jgi:hypothetical protein
MALHNKADESPGMTHLRFELCTPEVVLQRFYTFHLYSGGIWLQLSKTASGSVNTRIL